MPFGLFESRSRSAAPPSRFVALDIDGGVLRVVDAEPRGDKPRCRKLATVPLPVDLDRENASEVGRAIGDALRQLKLDDLKAVMDVPRGKAVLKTLTLPTADASELPGMVRFQVESDLPFAIDEAVIDFTLESPPESEPSANGTQPVLVAVVKQDVVSWYEQVAAEAKIKLHAIGLRPYADVCCLQACVTPEQWQQTLALVHLHQTEAEINVVTRGVMTFSRSATVPRGNGTAIDALAVEVIRTIQSATAAQGSSKVDRVFIAGDTGNETKVVDTLAQRLSLPCEVLDPTAALKLKKSKADPRGLVTPLGLAIGHGVEGRVPFDLLNPKRPPVERDLRKLRMIGGGVAAALLMLVLFTIGITRKNAEETRLAELRGRHTKLTNDLKPVTRLKKRLAEIEQWQKESRAWLDHWANVTALFPGPKDAYVTSLKGTAAGTIQISLRAKSQTVINDLADRLRKAGYSVKPHNKQPAVDQYGYTQDTMLTLTPTDNVKIDVKSLRAEPRPSDDGSKTMISQRRSSYSSRTSSYRPSTSSSSRSDDSRSSANNERSSSSTQGSSERGSSNSRTDERSSSSSRSSDERSSSSSRERSSSSGRDDDRSSSSRSRSSRDSKGGRSR